MSSDAIAPFVAALEAIVNSDKSIGAREEFQVTEMNSAVIVTALLELFGAVKAAGGLQPDVVQQTIAKYGWHRSVMAALAGLYESGYIQSLPDTCLPLLVQQVLSSDSLLRKSALQLLQSSNPASVIFSKCLEAQNTPLTIQSARERAMHIRKLGILLRNADAQGHEFKIGVAYCIAALKINFKPLWSEAIDSLETAIKGQKSPMEDTVWALLISELEKAITGQINLLVAERPVAWTSEASSVETDLHRLQQGEFRCTNNSRISQRFHAYFDELSGAVASRLSISLVC